MRSSEFDDLAGAKDEFTRALAHHLRDIRHLADYYRRIGLDEAIVADTLEGAAADIVEWASASPNRPVPSGEGRVQNPVSIRA